MYQHSIEQILTDVWLLHGWTAVHFLILFSCCHPLLCFWKLSEWCPFSPFMLGKHTLFPQRTHTIMQPISYCLRGQIHSSEQESHHIQSYVGDRGHQMASGSVPRQIIVPQQINIGSQKIFKHMGCSNASLPANYCTDIQL